MSFQQIILINSLVILAISCNKEDTSISDNFAIQSDITKDNCKNPPLSSDYREYQHGIDFVQKNDSVYYLIWGSSGVYPKGALNNGSWTHDVYYAELNIHYPEVNAKLLITANEAQEPPSTAIADNGAVFITMEDGNNVQNSVAQRYAVYDNDMLPLKDYPNMIFDGGHSGHVASVSNLFTVFWSNDWDDSVPGADGIGTGLDVLVDVYSSSGKFVRRTKVATDANRDWWPIVAGSGNYACLLWQRYVEGDKYSKLMYSIYNPQTGEFIKNTAVLENQLKYYTYDVQYYSEINRFLVVGSYYSGGGFAILLDETGNIVDKISNIQEIVREAQGVSSFVHNKLYVAYAKYPNGILLLHISAGKINFQKNIEDDYNWFGIGTDGIFMNDTCLYMINLSPCGLVKRQIYIN